MALAAVFQIGSLGDAVVSTPSLLSVRELLPDCAEYVLVTGFQNRSKLRADAVFNMAWRSSGSLEYWATGSPVRRAWSAAAVLARLRYLRPKYCVYLMPSERTERQVLRDRAFFRAAGINKLIGFRAIPDVERIGESGLRLERTEAYMRFHRLWNGDAQTKFAKYATPPFVAPSSEAEEHTRRWLGGNRRFPNRSLIAFCPFSNCDSRDLPDGIAVSVLKSLEQDLGLEAVVAGGGKDKESGTSLIRRAGAGLNACGCLTLEQSAALLRACRLAISVESGPMHLAGALGVPAVAVFSRVNASLNQWLAINSEQTVLYQDVPCAGCTAAQCPVSGHPCMTRTTAAEILAAVSARLKGSSAPAFASTHVLTWSKCERVPV